jgi:hypothetical protein
MSARSEESERQIKDWRARAFSASTEAMQALYQCCLTQSYCSRLEEKLMKQEIRMKQQQARLTEGLKNR